jgi:hypothetical protein
MTRVCAWCNTIIEGPRITGVDASDPVSHTMCRFCTVEHYLLGLAKKGAARVRSLFGR